MKARLRNCAGQGTAEYAIALFALLSIFLACALLWRTLEAGVFVEHAIQSASHHISGVFSGVLADILLY